MEHHESEASDQENHPAEDHQNLSRKRSTRACDQCRKTKSKCERSQGEDQKCKSCALAGTACTFLGPSYKRGPPKGYIHAIEQRWHQVESLVGALLQCPDTRVKSVLSDLRQDDLAREILDRVDMGPYGPSGRRLQSVESTKEDFFASVLKSNEMSHSRDPTRALRQSRVSREIVSSSQDHGLSVVPTKQWQDNLSQRLTSLSQSRSAPNSVKTSFSTTPSYTNLYNDNGANRYGPASQRRRLNDTPPMAGPDWSNLYTIDPTTDDEEFREATHELGQLSLDENQEVRFHGKLSGLHLLGRSRRADDRIEGGIWRLPMARVWPPSKFGLPSTSVENVEVHLPPIEEQDNLLNIYFHYVHPVFPIVHKARFLSEYNSRKPQGLVSSPAASPSAYSSPRPEPSQEITPLLLLSMFAVAARFREDEDALSTNGKMWEGGSAYVEDARKILNHVRNSRPSVVQSLILLGYREFGIGSMEQGWLLIGMGIRMAYDLGLNCDSSKWKINGHDLFNPEEIQTRRQIWWSCCLADRFGSLYMGRPVMIKDGDHDTPLPEINPVEDREPWQPIEPIIDSPYHPSPGRIMSALCAVSRLSVILGAIITKVYPIAPPAKESRQSILADLESRLDQWYYTLPDHLRWDPSPRRSPPPPQILFLHIRYWGAVLLLHRAFIPNWKRSDDYTPRNSTVGYRAFDLARGAACQMSSISTTYRETFGLRRTSPFMTSYLLSAGIMHVLTLTLRPDNVEAALGLEQCKAALKEMELAWPSASRAWELLNGVRVQTPTRTTPTYVDTTYQPRAKRPARDAFEPPHQPNVQYPAPARRDNYPQGPSQPYASTPLPQAPVENNGVQDLSTRMMAHMLGLELPGVEPSTSFFPGYEWWPRTQDQVAADTLGAMPDAPSYSGQTSDPNAILLGTAAMPDGAMNQGQVNWMSMQQPPQQQQQVNDLNLNYQYGFPSYGVQ